jgi:arylformamidase
MKSKYFDISPLISSDLAVFSGDTPYENPYLVSFKDGSHFSLSRINTTVHLGAHADAPFHYHPEGKTVDELDLNYYLGSCQVIDVNIKKASRITIENLANIKILHRRILFKTNSFNPYKWTDDFNALSVEVISFLANQGVILVGIDTPSVDLSDDKKLLCHQAIYKHKMAILEGLELNHINAGSYNLIALPLKLKGAEASPVRAILTEYQNSNVEGV